MEKRRCSQAQHETESDAEPAKQKILQVVKFLFSVINQIQIWSSLNKKNSKENIDITSKNTLKKTNH